MKKYNFQPPVTYNYAREVYTDYIKDNIIINIYFEGGYNVSLIKLKKNDFDILAGNKRVVNIDYSKRRFYDLSILDKKKTLLNSLKNVDEEIRNLVYFSTLLKNNPEILNGDFRKFSLWYCIKQRLKLKK